ncbi:hypothetical protein PL81_11045 [Streptomyces sp. RSD-27]|nr:hypothetical protein PL81_11045 [Streptomyces sp. RSD-27]
MLSVGDVAGHGIEAATGMVVLRNALRGLAVTGAGPGRLMSWLNTVTHHLTKQVTATAVWGADNLDGRLDGLLTESRSDTDDDTCVIGVRVE